MPLPTPKTPRKHIHTRRIVCEGYERDDGLFEVDGWITDTKTEPFTRPDLGGTLEPGTHLHSMGLRMTLGMDFVIRDIEAVTDRSPYAICPAIAPNFKKLIGLKIVHGFTAKSRELMAGTEGCTHLVELLGPIATTALQTMSAALFAKANGQPNPALINSCHGWSSEEAMVKTYWPAHYTGK